LDTVNSVRSTKNPNISSGDSPGKEMADKSSATFVSVGGDKLTLNLNTSGNLMDLETELPPVPTQPSNLELLSTLSATMAPSLPISSSSMAPISSLLNASTVTSTGLPAASLVSNSAASKPNGQLPVSVTHFSHNGTAGVQKETLFSDTFQSKLKPPSVMNPFTSTATNNSTSTTNPFINNSPEDNKNKTNGESNGQKFATIGRSNPFTSPNKSKNPFLDRLDNVGVTAATNGHDAPPTSTTGVTTTDYQTQNGGGGSPMSTSASTSPEASLDPVSDNGSSSTTLNKIETRFESGGAVTRSLSSVGSKQGSTPSRLPVLASTLALKSNVVNNNIRNNCISSKLNTSADNYTNNLINNNNTGHANTSLDDISPWLVKDNLIIKKPEKSKIPLLKTVITTEL